MMKKLLAVLLAGAMTLGLAACGSTGGSQNSAGSENASKGNAKYTVGICQLVQHDALDAATEGFKKALTDEFGDDVKFDEQNAQNDSNTCSTIINSFVSNGVDLILANAGITGSSSRNRYNPGTRYICNRVRCCTSVKRL